MTAARDLFASASHHAALEELASELTAAMLSADIVARYHALAKATKAETEGIVGASFATAPEDVVARAAAYLADRGFMLGDEVADALTQYRSYAAVLAADGNDALEAALVRALEQAALEGLDDAAAAALVEDALVSNGFAGGAWYPRLIANMASSTAYGYAQEAVFSAPAVRDLFPLIQYNNSEAHIAAGTVRPTHALLNGYRFLPNSAEAAALRVPTDFNCGCYWTGVPAEDADTQHLDSWPTIDGIPIAIGEGFDPTQADLGVGAREAALRMRLPKDYLDELPDEWRVVGVY